MFSYKQVSSESHSMIRQADLRGRLMPNTNFLEPKGQNPKHKDVSALVALKQVPVKRQP